MNEQQLNEHNLLDEVLDQLSAHKIGPTQIGDIVYELVHGYILDLTPAIATDSVMHVLAKREVQNAILTGLALDTLATQHLLPEPVQTIVENDEGLYGIDEQIAMSITSVYGSIGVTNFGFVDRTKPGVIGELNEHKAGVVNTFADDLVGAVAAAAAARLAHDNPAAVHQNFGIKHD
ncbi:phosphatidylglycerophosphatase A [Periweissella cryptocerci]|uniref:Phosphatidylglycerophosphatase A n=1 Tax=Periweissella cryptocerci TaxID=2506420 RepID=A0A4P6YUT8_9LACO|nr:phosphatidylglycerophosphatase A [Periweissella cryptocerci]QBO36496.1 phosphatidylglycerophosphatase A [Periweissella cryptocerci]